VKGSAVEDGAVTTAQDLSSEAQASLTELVIRGMARGDLDPALAPAVEAGLVLAKGPIVMPTPAGTALVGSWLRLADDAPERERITRTFHGFLPVNRRLRELCTAWQVRPDGSVNDHGDTGYDADVRDRLDDIHDSVSPLLGRFAQDLPRTAPYRARLEAALVKLDDGDNTWFTSPLIDSYHTVWMHLHQDLILALGLTRAEDEALEERLVAGPAE
jgi:hypothetical protein